MSGGVAYVLDAYGSFARRCNLELVELEPLSIDDGEELASLLRRHAAATGSAVAARLLADWPAATASFVKVMPADYKRALRAAARAFASESPCRASPAWRGKKDAAVVNGEGGECRGPGRAGERGHEDAMRAGERRGEAQQRRSRDEPIDRDRDAIGTQRPPGVSERRARHDGKDHGADGAYGQRVHCRARRHGGMQAVQPEEDQPEREPAVAGVQYEEQRLAQRCESAPACEAHRQRYAGTDFQPRRRH